MIFSTVISQANWCECNCKGKHSPLLAFCQLDNEIPCGISILVQFGVHQKIGKSLLQVHKKMKSENNAAVKDNLSLNTNNTCLQNSSSPHSLNLFQLYACLFKSGDDNRSPLPLSPMTTHRPMHPITADDWILLLTMGAQTHSHL